LLAAAKGFRWLKRQLFAVFQGTQCGVGHRVAKERSEQYLRQARKDVFLYVSSRYRSKQNLDQSLTLKHILSFLFGCNWWNLTADRQDGALKGELRSPAAKTPAASDMRQSNCMQL
jgi:hypothetical protein